MPINYWNNFDNDPTGNISPGWVNSSGSSFQVQTTGAVSGSHAMGEASYTNGHQAVYTAIAAAADQACQLSQLVHLDGSGAGANIGISLRADSAGSSSGYYFLPDFYLSRLLIFKKVGGTYTQIHGDAMGVSWTNGQTAIIKAQVQGNTLSWKAWAAGNAEPGSWTISITDSSVSTAGYAGVYAGNNSPGPGSSAPSFDDFFVGSAGVTFPNTVITGLTTNLFHSPYNWVVNSTTGKLTTINPGAEIDLNFSSTTQIALAVDVSAFANAAYPAGSYPRIKYSIGGGPLQTYQLQATDNVIQLASSLSGSSSLQLWLMGLDVYGGNPSGAPLTTKWSGANSLVIRGILLDYGAATTTYSSPSKTWLAYGDSITEGEWQLGTSVGNLASAVANEDATTSHVALLANALGAQICNVSFGGQAWEVLFDSDVPAFTSTWNSFYNGISRSFAVPPDYVSVNLGANNGLVSASTLTTFLTNLRSAVGSNTKIFVIVPFGGQGRANIDSGFASFIAINPADNARLIDLNDPRFVGTYGSSTSYLSDGLHPTQLGQSILAARLASVVQSDLASNSTTNGPTGTARSVGGLLGV